jgi:tRNA-dihydrouridine synthase 1
MRRAVIAMAAATAEAGAKPHGYDFFRRIGSPTTVVAPMVDASHIAFRLLCRRYGAALAYTPMLHARMMLESATYIDQHFETCAEDRPLIAQVSELPLPRAASGRA